jgi:hypothetical protein
VYNSQTRQVQRTFGRFKDVAYSGSFRQDGKLLVAGGQNSIVQVRGLLITFGAIEVVGCVRPEHWEVEGDGRSSSMNKDQRPITFRCS